MDRNLSAADGFSFDHRQNRLDTIGKMPESQFLQLMSSPIPEEAISSGPGSVMARPDNELILQAAIDEYNQNRQRLETQSVADDKSTMS